MALEPNADRAAIHDTIRHAFMDARKRGDSLSHAVIDIKTLLIVDLVCDGCGGEGHRGLPAPAMCPTCHGTGRRDVKVVDAESWDRFIRSERQDAEQWDRIAAVVRAVDCYLNDDGEFGHFAPVVTAHHALTADDIEAVQDVRWSHDQDCTHPDDIEAVSE